ncbi:MULTISPECIES: hypothetical protein [Mycolicibacterium]|uniref:hypothetical protein n=1 Tax=Mycolicibacterium TaxID=1866885 RepID=UPI001BDD53E8|nr:hypothetical protein [Mycolicibacterium goodii]MBU8841236.1 hypothetical protein [Mycolicibacterium goodii]
MTRPQVWISTTSKHIDYDGETPGNHWTLVGEIDSTQERAFLAAHVYGRTRGKSDFYLDGDPDVEWVQRADEQPQFWLAIDQWGSMRTSIQGGRPTFLVSRAPARVQEFGRRAPESHPGRIPRPIKVPIRLRRVEGAVFTEVEPPA